MDDLSFEEFEIEYKYLKAVIEGSGDCCFFLFRYCCSFHRAGLRVILPLLFPVSILSGYPDFRHPDIRM